MSPADSDRPQRALSGSLLLAAGQAAPAGLAGRPALGLGVSQHGPRLVATASPASSPGMAPSRALAAALPGFAFALYGTLFGPDSPAPLTLFLPGS